MWAETPLLTNDEVRLVEADLIEALNPIANVARPTPPDSLQAITEKVFASFRQLIHQHRVSKFGVKLAVTE